MNRRAPLQPERTFNLLVGTTGIVLVRYVEQPKAGEVKRQRQILAVGHVSPLAPQAGVRQWTEERVDALLEGGWAPGEPEPLLAR